LYSRLDTGGWVSLARSPFQAIVNKAPRGAPGYAGYRWTLKHFKGRQTTELGQVSKKAKKASEHKYGLINSHSRSQAAGYAGYKCIDQIKTTT
jgi:hypothetical protein